MDGKKPVGIPGGLESLELEHLDGDGERVSWGVNGGRAFVAVDQPGRYRFSLPKLPGYAALPPQVVELTGPEPLLHVVPLVAE